MRKDRRTDMTKAIVALRSFAGFWDVSPCMPLGVYQISERSAAYILSVKKLQ